MSVFDCEKKLTREDLFKQMLRDKNIKNLVNLTCVWFERGEKTAGREKYSEFNIFNNEFNWNILTL